MNLEKNFTYHPPKEGQPEKYATIRKMAHEYAEFLQENCPQSRELSLALTNLEQAVMWANASIARNSQFAIVTQHESSTAQHECQMTYKVRGGVFVQAHTYQETCDMWNSFAIIGQL